MFARKDALEEDTRMYCRRCGAEFPHSSEDTEAIYGATEILRDRLLALGVPIDELLKSKNPLKLFDACIVCCKEPNYFWNR